MKFPTLYDPVKVIPQNAGNVFETQYSQRYKADGTPYLEAQKIKKNNYQIVQSNKDICDYSAMMRKYYATGDDSILNRGVKGSFGDFTEAPTDLIDAQNKINAGIDAFNALPVDVRAEYHNNPYEFLASFDTDNFLRILNGRQPEAVDNKDEKIEVTENAD